MSLCLGAAAKLNLDSELQADIVVVGCRGMGNLKRALMGSVSTYAVHHTNVPVIVVRSNYIPSRL